jgi:holo-[acyl-carrier protein] synthase
VTVLGVGVDLLQIARVRSILDGAAGDGFVAATFTDEEVLAARRDGDPAVAFATRFAIKEAVFKCLHVTFAEGDGFRDIEVHADRVGAPYVTLSGRFASLLAEREATAPSVSVSFEDQHVVAIAVLSGGAGTAAGS